MTATEFNALPVEVRRFIEKNAGCLSCGGNKEAKLTKAYELYKTHKKMNVYQLKGGGINYVKENKGGVLYPIGPNDSDDEIREKIAIAKEIHEVKPHVFIAFNEKEMDELLESLEPAEVIDLDAEAKALEAKAAAEAAAEAKAAAEAAAEAKAPKTPVRGNGGKFQKKDATANADDEI